MIYGDFDSHTYLWGKNKTDAKGKVMESFITKSNTFPFNDDIQTCQHPATDSFTSVDFTMRSPSLFKGFHLLPLFMLCLCVEAFHPDHIEDEGLQMKTFINKLCEFDNEIIPKSYPTPMKPWFSGECRQAILACKISLRTLKRFSSDVLLQGYCIKRAKEIRQVICADDQSSWREYVSIPNARTPIERKLVHGLQNKG